MLDEQPGAPDIQALLGVLHERVEERRRSGEYPEDLERELSHHYQQILAGHGLGTDRTERLLRNLDNACDIGPHRIQSVSSLPLGTAVHRTVAKMVARQTEGILWQVAQLARATRDVVVELAEAQPRGPSGLSDITARIDDILDRLAQIDRTERDLPEHLARLEARLAGIEAAMAANHPPTT